MHAWVEEELVTVSMGDERLDDRFGILLGQLSDHPSLSIPGACGEQGYRRGISVL